jgi:DNA-binding transcriptional ArsR family regulator
MASKPAVPDYELTDTLEWTDAAQVQAIGNELRTTILGLLHERAATVTELASAVDRPKSTVAYHVGVLHDAGLIRVVRTRRVRAIEERYFGRTARMFYVGVGQSQGGDPLPLDFNDFEVAARESKAAYEAHRLASFIRHARVPPERISEFWARAMSLVHEFDRLPRSGDTTYGFVLGVYPISDYPLLPEPKD